MVGRREREDVSYGERSGLDERRWDAGEKRDRI